MHGLINRAVQCFVCDTYGTETWETLARASDVPVSGFESMFVYEDVLTERMLASVSSVLGKPVDAFLEDLGTYLVSNPNLTSIRRLLRFGGETFIEFLYSVDDLPRWARLAMPDLVLPAIEIFDDGGGEFRLSCHGEKSGFGHVLAGVLRTMADDYGALVLLDHQGRVGREERLSLRLLANGFTEARPFTLSGGRLA